MNTTTIIIINLLAAVFCGASAAMNFIAGDMVVGSVMAGLFFMNILMVVVNANRH